MKTISNNKLIVAVEALINAYNENRQDTGLATLDTCKANEEKEEDIYKFDDNF